MFLRVLTPLIYNRLYRRGTLFQRGLDTREAYETTADSEAYSTAEVLVGRCCCWRAGVVLRLVPPVDRRTTRSADEPEFSSDGWWFECAHAAG